MLELEGGRGGGQQLRTALSLSVVTGTPFRMTEIRGGRPDPGLKPQHRGAVTLAASVADADVEGDAVGSTSVEFAPTGVASDPVEVDLGTAGSVTLLADTVLPVAVALDDPLVVTARGGTDVAWSPTADYLRHAKLPLLARSGFETNLDVVQRGFYPTGDGEVRLTVEPSDPTPLDVTGRGAVESVAVHSVAARSLAGPEVAERQAEAAVELLAERADAPVTSSVGYDETTCAGSAVTVVVACEGGRAGFDALGEKGVPAETIGERAADPAAGWLDAPSAPPVDRRLADQLLVPLALAGGEVVVPEVTDHVETNVETIRAFGYEVSVTERADGTALVSAPV
jgi:RNA 3'-terminal phosphate cyclase (ATP)